MFSVFRYRILNASGIENKIFKSEELVKCVWYHLNLLSKLLLKLMVVLFCTILLVMDVKSLIKNKMFRLRNIEYRWCYVLVFGTYKEINK